jgi:hypothetical protein
MESIGSALCAAIADSASHTGYNCSMGSSAKKTWKRFLSNLFTVRFPSHGTYHTPPSSLSILLSFLLYIALFNPHSSRSYTDVFTLFKNAFPHIYIEEKSYTSAITSNSADLSKQSSKFSLSLWLPIGLI